jgi:uncharacterized protein (UPF0261 family)
MQGEDMKKQLLIITTLDTKGTEGAYVRDCVKKLRMPRKIIRTGQTDLRAINEIQRIVD